MKDYMVFAAWWLQHCSKVIAWWSWNLLFRIIHPHYWLQNYPSDFRWDEAVRRAIETGPVVRIDEYSAKVGPYKIWVENYPYAFGSKYQLDVSYVRREEKLPYPITRKRLYKLIKDQPHKTTIQQLQEIKDDLKELADRLGGDAGEVSSKRDSDSPS